ncbi:MAG: mechanosensitive ion channel family protein [Pseudomonadales bacterium]|nr:mechanosensitive ion channel family protein [Pseudomonadales bacterium]
MEIENPLGEEIAQVQKVYDMLTEFFVNYSMQVIGALIILIAGYYIARACSRWVVRMLTTRNLDITLSELIGSITYFAVLFCFVVIALGKFGISITPFVAALGAFTLGAGLAVQGIVSNYGAGFSIILTRPFVVGNTLTVQGVSGVVEQIRLAYTVLSTEDGEKITIPNREIIGQILENSFEYKLVETRLALDPQTDPEAAIAALTNALQSAPEIASEPPLQIGIDDFTDFNIRIGVRFWVPTASYYQARYTINGLIYRTIKAADIRLAVPRQQIQMLNGG